MIPQFEMDRANTQRKNGQSKAAQRGKATADGVGVYLLVSLAVILFFAGFFAGEDGFGGNIRADLYLFHEPTIWAFRTRPLLAVLPAYNSATTPLFHVLESFNPLLGQDVAFRATNTLFAFLTCSLFICAIYHRFRSISTARTSALLIGASILLSPYFRAESYWVSTDVLPVFLIIVTAMLLNRVQDSDLRCRLTVSPWVLTPFLALVSWSCFYCRQTNLYMPFYACLVLIWRFRTNWWWIVFVFGICGVPAIYLVHTWKGLTPPGFQRHQGLSLDAIVQPLSMMLIYAVPFLVEMLAGIIESLAPRSIFPALHGCI